MGRLIELEGYATAEICEEDGRPVLVIINELCQGVELTLESARKLYGALRTFDSEGLLGD